MISEDNGTVNSYIFNFDGAGVLSRSDMIDARFSHAVVKIGLMIYVFGGGSYYN